MSIRYTTGQFRDTLGLSKETFRYWRNNLPDLASHQGPSSKFGPAELLATAILKHINDQTGVPVGKLSEVAPDLFQICRLHAWPQLEGSTVVLYLQDKNVDIVAHNDQQKHASTAISTPLSTVIEQLRGRLLDDYVTPQHNLVFPPHSVSARGM